MPHQLLKGATKSCGCLKNEIVGERYRTHGRSGSPEYTAWGRMISRCSQPKHVQFASYGGRGITVCKEWQESFAKFFAHIGPRPGPQYSLDRILNERPYEPGNVRWATLSQQARNKRTTTFLTFNGERKPLATWAEETSIPLSVLRRRLKNGWHEGRALSEPHHGIPRR